MTILEKLQEVGYRTTISSRTDNLVSICFRVYNTHSEIGTTVLKVLNPRFDWDDLTVGTEIKYIPLEFLSDVTEYDV